MNSPISGSCIAYGVLLWVYFALGVIAKFRLEPEFLIFYRRSLYCLTGSGPVLGNGNGYILRPQLTQVDEENISISIELSHVAGLIEVATFLTQQSVVVVIPPGFRRGKITFFFQVTNPENAEPLRQRLAIGLLSHSPLFPAAVPNQKSSSLETNLRLLSYSLVPSLEIFRARHGAVFRHG